MVFNVYKSVQPNILRIWLLEGKKQQTAFLTSLTMVIWINCGDVISYSRMCTYIIINIITVMINIWLLLLLGTTISESTCELTNSLGTTERVRKPQHHNPKKVCIFKQYIMILFKLHFVYIGTLIYN